MTNFERWMARKTRAGEIVRFAQWVYIAEDKRIRRNPNPRPWR